MTVLETGGVRYNDAPLSASHTDNWVARRGGLPPMVRAIARALMRNGHSESGAISVAIGAVKRWAAGGGKVRPETRARAAAAVAHWEAIKGSSGRTAEEDLVREAVEAAELRRTEGMDVRAQAGPAGSADAKAAQGGAKSTAAKGSSGGAKGPAKGAYAAGHPFHGNQHAKVAGQPGIAVGGKGSSTTPFAKAGSGGGGAGGKAAAAAAKAAALTATYQSASTTLANATLSAQKASEAHTQAQAKLAAAGAESQQDKFFAEQKLPPNRPNQNTAQLDAQALDAVDKSSSARIAAAAATAESARISHEMAQNTLADASRKYLAAKAAAGVRADGMDLVVTRDGFVGETTGEGADKFLPVGPSKKQGDAINAKLKDGHTGRHRFKGSDLDHCADCGEQLMSPAHGSAPGQPIPSVPRQIRAPHARHKPSDPQNCKDHGHPATKSIIWAEGAAYIPVCDEHEAKYVDKIGGPNEVNDIIPIDNSDRHAGPDGHVHAPTGHIKGVPSRHIAAAAAQAASHMAAVEGPLEESMRSFFHQQRKSTLSRLEGKRGKQTLKRAGGPNEPPEIPPEDTGAQGEIPPSIDMAGVFDAGFWAAKTAEVLQPHLSTAGNLAAGSVRQQVGLDPMTDDSTSLGALKDIIAARAQTAADYISGTTAKQLTGALQEGVANGEGTADIAKRINAVFDKADMTRAKRIAQTEVVGAYNQGALAYASQLPSDVVGTRRWLSHHDHRTRPTHRMADGQEQPMGSPFYVGGATLMAPGDKSAPVGEWINCVPGDTRVEWVGALSAVFRRWYDGDLIKLTSADGRVLSVTPNHPILTRKGWTAAQFVHEGDEAYCTFGVESRAQPDVDDLPPSVEELYRAASQVWPTRRIGGSAMDFHGDGAAPQVEVVGASGDLTLDAEATPDELRSHEVLIGVSLGARLLPRPGSGRGSTAATSSSVTRGAIPGPTGVEGAAGTLAPLGGREPHPGDVSRFTHGSSGEPQFGKPSNDDRTAHAEVFAHGQDAHLVLVEATQIVRVDVSSFHGFVFNLMTEQGWYTGNGIATHNCRCSVAYMPPGMAYNGIAAAAEAYVAGLKAKPPPAVTPYTVPA